MKSWRYAVSWEKKLMFITPPPPVKIQSPSVFIGFNYTNTNMNFPSTRPNNLSFNSLKLCGYLWPTLNLCHTHDAFITFDFHILRHARTVWYRSHFGRVSPDPRVSIMSVVRFVNSWVLLSLLIGCLCGTIDRHILLPSVAFSFERINNEVGTVWHNCHDNFYKQRFVLQVSINIKYQFMNTSNII